MPEDATPEDAVTAADVTTTEGRRAGRSRSRVAPFVALGVAAVMAALFVVFAGSEPAVNETAETHLRGRAAPAATGVLADGSEFELARRRGSWVVLNYFTSDCVPCQQEHPDLVAFAGQQAALGADGAELITVVYDDDRDAVEEFFAREGGDWPIVYDTDGSMAVSFGVSKVPETWIIDPNGVVQERFISRVTADFLAAQLGVLRAQA